MAFIYSVCKSKTTYTKENTFLIPNTAARKGLVPTKRNHMVVYRHEVIQNNINRVTVSVKIKNTYDCLG